MRYLLFSLCLLAVSCGSKSGDFTIKGTLPDGRYDNTYVYIERRDILSQYPPLWADSALVENGAFTIGGMADEMPAVYTLVIPAAVGPHYTLPIIIDKGVMHITYDDKAASLKGGRTAERYNDLVLSVKRDVEIEKEAIVAERTEKERGGQLPYAETEVYNGRIREAYAKQIPSHTQFVRENIDNPVGWYFFFSTAPARYAAEDYRELYSAIPETLRAKYEAREKAKTDKQAYFQFSQKEMIPGNAARELTGLNIAGNSVALTDFHGKVVLIDFWASWCVPCVQEVPELKELYARYKPHGFEIIGFSVDKDEKAWRNAVTKHELPWVNISDMRAWDSQAIADYGVQAIPFTMLIDRDGKIAGRNVHAHNLTTALEKLFPGK